MTLPSYRDLEIKAKELGFDRIGLLSLAELNLDETCLRKWLDSGFNADMQWMAENMDKRTHPDGLMAGAKTVLCAVMNYYPGLVPKDSKAKIARYAQGNDYHAVLKDRLKKLLLWLKTFDPAVEGRPLTDSAPVMERTLAIYAGLGWQGKNGNIIIPQVGSWVFLAELLLNVTFADAPEISITPDRCGSCRRCIDACPTNAIISPRVIDATRCISYWTIEHKGDKIPDDISNNLNGWIFGCDICQEVCPWNIKFQHTTDEDLFKPRPWNRYPKSDEIALMSEEQFRVRYRKSPIKRTGLCRLKRNINALK